MSREVTISDDVRAAQQRAGNPLASVWVSANAGSGKTHVLTERVLRLLLTGVPPDQILCLTYTKAAAAEMRKRVASRLAGWAVMSETVLLSALAETEGARPDIARMSRARTLFAHALETPGGLKIMTIHAYCESVLHRFPKEAAVPFDFEVVEDNERDRMLGAARDAVLAEGLRGEGEAEAVATLFGLLSDSQIGDAIGAALGQQRTLRHVLADVPRAKRVLRRMHGIGREAARDAVLARITGGYGLSAADHAAIFDLSPSDPQGTGFVDKLARIEPAHPDVAALRAAFLTSDGTARKRLLSAAAAKALPAIAQKLADEAARLEALGGDLVAADLIERSEALLDVLAAISARYETVKRSRSRLDFDDLIEALRRLLADDAIGPWVRYKLDAGITHILVDESQDTNNEQWQVIRLLAADFFDGESAAQRVRTLFAVGDKKQSIYSFQGAEPELFVDLGNQYATLVRTARMAFDEVPLSTSFRTLPAILEAVDRVFLADPMRAGVLAEDKAVRHFSARREQGGVVTLWPPVQESGEDTDPESWATLPPPQTYESAPRQIAGRIAREIKGWIAARRPLGPRGLAVSANDVLILVQTRGPLFREIIRALVRAGLPTPGADRLPVTGHIAVLDLMALGDVLLNPGDDLQLAALLRSPLFAVSEDELYEIAAPRGEDEPLWDALAASSIDAAAAAYERLQRWRSRLDFERPFTFYADVLYAEGGLRSFHARLGAEVDDVLAEFLDLALTHERAPQPSLQGFLAALRETSVAIKRELSEAGGGVRVMTVHGAKGLEAPIVILADAASTEAGRGGSPAFLNAGPEPYLIHASSVATHTPQTLALRQEEEKDGGKEYWRKLYVAMTRAEDELYVTGSLTRTGKIDGSWYAAIEGALRDDAELVSDAEGNAAALVYPRQRGTPRPAGAARDARAAMTPLLLPDLPEYRLRQIVRPSSAFGATDAATILDGAADQLADRRDPDVARREGLALHALLQHLSRLEPPIWPSVSAKALAVLLPEAPDRHAALAQKAASILARPELGHLFSPQSRAEVPILAQATRDGRAITIAGRIDRLVVEPGRVWVVDYKSDDAVPETEAGVPAGYLRQIGLYALVAGQLFPGHEVVGAILWTRLERLMNLAPQRLRQAVAGFTIG